MLPSFEILMFKTQVIILQKLILSATNYKC